MAYIGQANPNGSRSFDQERRDRTKPLAQHPELGPTAMLGLPMRELVVHQNYINFYRMLAEAALWRFCE